MTKEGKTLAGRVLVTSGPTRAYFDRIRYIANTSSGALGKIIVETLAAEGFDVVHIYGAGSMHCDEKFADRVEAIEIETVDDLIDAVHKFCKSEEIQAVVHAMAVLDYQPETRLTEKKKSGGDNWSLNLVKTPKVTPIIRELVPDARFIGFKLESNVSEDELINRAYQSLQSYGLDAVLANDLDKVTAESHEAVIIGKDGGIMGRAGTKAEIANLVRDIISK